MKRLLLAIAMLLFILPPAVLAKDAGAVCCPSGLEAMAGMAMPGHAASSNDAIVAASPAKKPPAHQQPCSMAFLCAAALDPLSNTPAIEPVRYATTTIVAPGASGPKHSILLEPRLRPPIA